MEDQDNQLQQMFIIFILYLSGQKWKWEDRKEIAQ